MRTPLFSVVLPTFNRAEYLAEAIASVLAQSLQDFECIVVDDASPRSATVPDDSRIRLVRRDTNGGDAAARNEGIRLARGRYVTFLDDDDLYMPNRFALALEGLERSALSICWRQGSDGSLGGNRLLEGNVWHHVLDDLTPSLGQVAVERSALLPFDVRFIGAADVEWWLRTTQRVGVSSVPHVGYIVRRHQGERGRIGVRARMEASLLLLKEYEDYFRRHQQAAAFRWKRVGLLAGKLGEQVLARRAFIQSLLLRPQAKTAWHLVRSLRKTEVELVR